MKTLEVQTEDKSSKIIIEVVNEVRDGLIIAKKIDDHVYYIVTDLMETGEWRIAHTIFDIQKAIDTANKAYEMMKGLEDVLFGVIKDLRK